MILPLPYIALALAAATTGPAWAAQCSQPALGETVIYLRGGMTSWGVDDDYAFSYRCDAYYLNVNASGLQEFKLSDPAWSLPNTFGAAGDARFDPQGQLALARASESGNPGNLKFSFGGDHTLKLTFVDGKALLAIGPKTFADPNVKPLDNKIALSLSHDSRRLADKSPFGSVTTGSTVDFAINAAAGVSGLALVVEKRKLEGNQEVLDYTEVARIPMTRGGDGRWSARYKFADASIYGYYFEADIGGERYIYQNNRNPVYWTREKGSNGLGAVQHPGKGIRRFRQTVYAPDFTVPAWAKDAVYYYIFPERFRNGDKRNDQLVGTTSYQDLGIELHSNWNDKPYRPGSGDGSDKISNNDFFGGDLKGVIDKLDYIRALGANTLYMTPVFRAASNHKYDTADYRNIDPHFGSNEDYIRLTREAAKRGMRVITDASFNHTGSDSVYFDRYAKYDAVGALEGGKITAASPYASWYKFNKDQGETDKLYTGWAGASDLPELDKASPAFRQFAYGGADAITRLWLDRGAAGWRMDVAPWVPDDFWREWRKAVKSHRGDALTIAETWFDASKYFLGDTFDTTMNYIFRNAVLDYAAGTRASVAYQNIELMREAYPAQSFYALMNLLSTHDQARSLHVLGDTADAALAKRRFRLALFFQMMFPGAPAVYYGDEVGVSGGDDPANRATYPWADQGGKPDLAMLAEFKQLIAMRKKHKVLRHGSIDAPLLVDDNVIVLARKDGATWAICATNNASEPKVVKVKLPAGAAGNYVNALSRQRLASADGYVTLTVPAMFGAVFISAR